MDIRHPDRNNSAAAKIAKGPLSPEDTIEIIAQRQNMTFWERMKASFRAALIDSAPYKILYYIDHFTTYIRSLQVYSNWWANYKSNPALQQMNTNENDDSAFYWVMTENGQGTAVTDIGWVLFTGGFVAPVVGVGIDTLLEYQKYKKASLHHLKDSLEGIGINKSIETLGAETKEYYLKLFRQGKVVNLADQTYTYQDDAETLINEAYKPDENTRLSGIFGGKFHISERSPLTDFLGCNYEFSKKVDEREESDSWFAALGLSAIRILALFNDYAYRYWIVWFPFVLVVGLAAVTGGLSSLAIIYLPIVISIALAFTLVAALPKIVNWVKNSSKHNEDLEQEHIAEKRKTEIARMAVEFQDRIFMKEKHGAIKRYLMDAGQLDVEELNNAKEMKRAEKKLKEPPVPGAPRLILPRTKEEVQRGRLAQYLLEGSSARIPFAIFIDIVNAIIALSFIFWVTATTIFAFAGATIPVFLFFDSMFNSGIAGFIVGAITGVSKYFEMKEAQRDYEERIHRKLSEQYKEGIDETKQECFERLEHCVEQKRAHVEWLRLHVLLKDQHEKYLRHSGKYNWARQIEGQFKDLVTFNKDTSPDTYKAYYQSLHDARVKVEDQLRRQGLGSDAEREKLLATKDDFVAKIDVHREKSVTATGVLDYVWTILKFLQTGSLFWRTVAIFVLGGALGIAAYSGTLPLFIGVAVAFAVGFAAVGIYQHYFEDKRQKREDFLVNLDTEIKNVNNSNKELTLLERVLDPEVVKLPHNPKNSSNAYEIPTTTPEISLEISGTFSDKSDSRKKTSNDEYVNLLPDAELPKHQDIKLSTLPCNFWKESQTKAKDKSCKQVKQDPVFISAMPTKQPVSFMKEVQRKNSLLGKENVSSCAVANVESNLTRITRVC